MVKSVPANAGDMRDVGSIPRPGRSPGRENGYPFWYSGLENPTDRGAWRATVHGVAESQTGLRQVSMHEQNREQAQGGWAERASHCLEGTHEPGQELYPSAECQGGRAFVFAETLVSLSLFFFFLVYYYYFFIVVDFVIH